MSKTKIKKTHLIEDAKKLLELLKIKKYSAILYEHPIDDEANLFIISEEFHTNMERRQTHIFSVSSQFPNIEVIGWTLDEFRKRSKRTDEFLNKIKKSGIILKDDYQIFQ
ncbi:MAG: hypothetical protein ABIL89_08330 [candidate division WOR-3 bacterium]|jgi:hypothetical protein